MIFFFVTRLKKLFFILLSFNSKVYYSFLFYFVSPSFEHFKIIRKIKNINTYIDVGSNKGQFSLLINLMYPNKKILAFEPLKTEYKIYQNIFYKCKNIKCINIALGNKIRKKKIYITKRTQSSSLHKPKHYSNTIFKSTNFISASYTKVKPLTNFLFNLKKPIFLKIDVQGFELEVLKGTDLNQIQYIYLEGSYLKIYKNQPLIKDIKKFLNIRNFKLIGEFNLFKKNNKKIQSDFLFINKKNFNNYI